jgi:hypothetical protein
MLLGCLRGRRTLGCLRFLVWFVLSLFQSTDLGRFAGMFRRSAPSASEEQKQEPDLVHLRVFVTRLGHVQVQLDLVSAYPSSPSSLPQQV